MDPEEHLTLFLTQSNNESDKISIVMTESTLKFFEIGNGKILSWQTLPNYILLVSHSGFTFKSNNFFLEVTENLIQKFLPAGIMKHFYDQCFPYIQVGQIIKNWKVLTLNQLNFGFVIWLGCCGICFLFFTAELLFYLFCRIIKKTRSKKCIKKVKKYSKVYPANIKIEELNDVVQIDENIFRVKKFRIQKPVINKIQELDSISLCLSNDGISSKIENDGTLNISFESQNLRVSKGVKLINKIFKVT